jgi:hypothetical protein
MFTLAVFADVEPVPPCEVGRTGASTIEDAVNNLGLSNIAYGKSSVVSDINDILESGCYFFTETTKNIPSNIRIKFGTLIMFNARDEFGLQILVSDIYSGTELSKAGMYIRPMYKKNFRRWIEISLKAIIENDS